ncbi:MAG: sigma-70 family RNA polymerase sigma factor [Planctomycetota bacterium]
MEELLASRSELRASLRSYLSRRVPASDVDDLLQECMLRIARGVGTLPGQERLDAWIFRVAANLVVDHLRRRRRHPLQLQDDTDLPGREGADEDGQTLRRLAPWLAQVVEHLPEAYAKVLHQADLEEIPHREIAARLGLSVSAVKSRVSRGRALLRERLLACCSLELDGRGAILDCTRNHGVRCGC